MSRARSLYGLVVLALVVPISRAQVRGDLLLYGEVNGTGHNVLNRFSRRLDLLSSTDVGSLGVVTWDPTDHPGLVLDGSSWISCDPLWTKFLLHFSPTGQILPLITIGHNPMALVTSATGTLYALTRIPLTVPAPLYAVDSQGAILWANGSGPTQFKVSVPTQTVVTSAGDLWIGGVTSGIPTSPTTAPMMLRIDLATGNVVQTYYPPAPGGTHVPPQQTFMPQMEASIDGTIWGYVNGGFVGGQFLFRTDGTGVLDCVPIVGGWNGTTNAIRVDGKGDCWLVSSYDPAGSFGTYFYRFGVASGSQGIMLEELSAGGHIKGFALGTSGRDLYVETVSEDAGPPFPHHLRRINLVTKVASAVRLDTQWFNNWLPYGDPNGFEFANVIDRAGDNDGDGITNGAETAARSDPFDAKSRPEGPTVELRFLPGANAISLRYSDPDGLLNPAAGLDLASLSLVAGPYGEILPLLLNFISSVALTPDGKSATIEFGALPIPQNLKLPLDARVRDKTGAEGWDWQVTPPGIL